MSSTTLTSQIDAKTLAELRLCCQCLDNKKALDLKVLDVSGKSSITDFFIVATGTSEPHLKAMRDEITKAFKSARISIMGLDQGVDSGWLVIDAFDIIIHLFLEDVRESYNLEGLWKDASELNIADLIDAS